MAAPGSESSARDRGPSAGDPRPSVGRSSARKWSSGRADRAAANRGKPVTLVRSIVAGSIAGDDLRDSARVCLAIAECASTRRCFLAHRERQPSLRRPRRRVPRAPPDEMCHRRSRVTPHKTTHTSTTLSSHACRWGWDAARRQQAARWFGTSHRPRARAREPHRGSAVYCVTDRGGIGQYRLPLSRPIWQRIGRFEAAEEAALCRDERTPW